MKNSNKFNPLILDKVTDTRTSLILSKAKVSGEIIKKSESIVINKFKDQFFPIRFLKNHNTEEFVVNNPASKPVKLPTTITEDICKIWGALAADGHISTKSKPEYIIQITDGDFSAMISFQSWIENCFGIKPKIRKYPKVNAWRICITSKVIGRYLVSFLKFPTNKKSGSIKVPQFLDSKEKIKSFLIGVFTFDAGVNLNSNIEFLIKNGSFFKSILELLDKLDVPYTSNRQIDKNNQWRLHTYRLDKTDLIKWLGLFAKNSEKYLKIKDLINGYKKTPSSKEQVLQSFQKTFPTKNASLVSLSDVFLYLQEKKTTTIHGLATNLNIKKDTTIKYREILKKCNIIKEERINKGKSRILIKFTENLNEWKIPWRNHYDN